jgi:hypothetical protein
MRLQKFRIALAATMLTLAIVSTIDSASAFRYGYDGSSIGFGWLGLP